MDKPILHFAQDCFPDSYFESRKIFLQLAKEAGAEIDSFAYPGTGCQGEDLFTDVALVGSSSANKLLVICSGTHGVEGYVGAACQLQFLMSYARSYAGHRDLAFLLVHALNPWGYSYDRRVTEENVDLNRNFIDFDQRELPSSDAYAAYHDQLLPRKWFGTWRRMRDLRFLIEALGPQSKVFQSAITAGQYSFGDGLFFGGRAPTLSHLVWRRIVNRYVSNRPVAALLDIHSGLGRRGYGHLLSHLSSAHADFKLMQQWFGERLRICGESGAVSAQLHGTLGEAFQAGCHGACYAVVLEFGTIGGLRVLNALRADHWAHVNRARLLDRDMQMIRRRMRNAFYIQNPRWKRSILINFKEVLRRYAEGLRDLTLDTPSSPVSARNAGMQIAGFRA